MSTIVQLKAGFDAAIRNQTADNSVTRAAVSNQLNAIVDELLERGIKVVADTTALSALSGANFKIALVDAVGMFEYATSGTANGSTIFAASGGGVWIKRFSGSGSIYDNVAYSSVIKFDNLFTKQEIHSITANITFSKNVTSQFPGASTLVKVIGDGVHTINTSAFKKSNSSQDFDDRNGILNCISFFYDGDTHWCNIWQEIGALPVDMTSPILISAEILDANPDTIVLTYDEALANVTPATSDFTISGKTVSGVVVTGSTVEVTVSVAWISSDTVTINYVPGTNKIQDASGNFAAALTAQAVDNQIGVTSVPLTIQTALAVSQSGSDWVATGANGYDNNDVLANQKIASGTDGYVTVIMTSALAEDCVFGLKTANSIPTTYTDIMYGAWLSGGFYYYRGSGGGGSVPGSYGDWLWMGREGGSVKVKYSTNAGASWTNLFDLGAISGDLFIGGSIATTGHKIFSPTGYGVV